MSNVTRILSDIEGGDLSAADELLPLVYGELRNLAAQWLTHEKPGQTLQPTALVHEAYVRLVDVDRVQHWDSRGHFFAAAAEAMRRILVDHARRKRAKKRRAKGSRQPLDGVALPDHPMQTDILAVDEALETLARTDAEAAQLVKLRYFAGLTSREAAEVLEVSPRTADRIWRYARSFLLKQLTRD